MPVAQRKRTRQRLRSTVRASLAPDYTHEEPHLARARLPRVLQAAILKLRRSFTDDAGQAERHPSRHYGLNTPRKPARSRKERGKS